MNFCILAVIYLSLEYVELFLHLRLRHNGLIVINYSTQGTIKRQNV